MLSRQSLEEGEWRLHPQMVNCIWQAFGEAEVDLFASSKLVRGHSWARASSPRGDGGVGGVVFTVLQ